MNPNNNNINFNSIDGIEFKKKLELSYQQCLTELTNPPNWEKQVNDIKYKINPNTGMLTNELIFDTVTPDEIKETTIIHSYIFKRSHFYRNSSRLKHEIETIWNKRGYYVKLLEIYPEPNSEYPKKHQWRLKISWKY